MRERNQKFLQRLFYSIIKHGSIKTSCVVYRSHSIQRAGNLQVRATRSINFGWWNFRVLSQLRCWDWQWVIKKSLGLNAIKLADFQARSRNCGKRLLASSCLSLCPSICPSVWTNSLPTGRILMKFQICGIIENLSEYFKFH